MMAHRGARRQPNPTLCSATAANADVRPERPVAYGWGKGRHSERTCANGVVGGARVPSHPVSRRTVGVMAPDPGFIRHASQQRAGP
jgi:hypothetical protein